MLRCPQWGCRRLLAARALGTQEDAVPTWELDCPRHGLQWMTTRAPVDAIATRPAAAPSHATRSES